MVDSNPLLERSKKINRSLGAEHLKLETLRRSLYDMSTLLTILSARTVINGSADTQALEELIKCSDDYYDAALESLRGNENG